MAEGVARGGADGHLAEVVGVDHIGEHASAADHIELAKQFLLSRLLDGALGHLGVLGHCLQTNVKVS